MAMQSNEKLQFPSGRNVKRLKQDAKLLSKSQQIPLSSALDCIAKANGMSCGWSKALAQLRNNSIHKSKISPQHQESAFAQELGITDDELSTLSWEVEENSSDDDLIYSYFVKFDDSNPRDILDKIDRLDPYNTVEVSVNAFDEPDFDETEETYPPVNRNTIPSNKNINPYRKLLSLGINELLIQRKFSLNWNESTKDGSGYIEALIAGHNSVIQWRDVGHGELQISIWWKYQHENHPQAYLEGRQKEEFTTPSPLANRKHYSKFVGVVCSGWLERQTSAYLQGHGNSYLTDIYTRRGELEELKKLVIPAPFGFNLEGKFFL
ncbi:hypothetical protein AB4238_11210 [Shewanella sp. 10N.286.45.A1]|uniref:hypothetical protein n=1 Tax=Shewanella sp. 10N.286.45.A1 TaxID=3229694 RepID=UPI0035507434